MSKDKIFWQKNISIFWFSVIIFGWLIILGFGFNLYYSSSVNLQLNDDGRVLGSYNTNQGAIRTKAWGGGGGDVTSPTSILDNYLSDYYNNADIPDYIYGYASDASDIQYVDILISKTISGTTYHWEESTHEWTTTETWNSTDNYSTWSWSAVNFKNNISDGVVYTINSRATDNSSNHNVETNITDESQTIFTYDISGPTTPFTLNDGTSSDIDSTTSTSELSANWTASTDGSSGLAKYQYAIGTTSGTSDVVSWTDNGISTSVTKTGLTLINNQTYYFSVRGVDNLGNIGSAKNSDGIKVEIVTNSNSDTNNATSSNSSNEATTNSTSQSNSSASESSLTATSQESLTSDQIATAEIQTTSKTTFRAAVDKVNLDISQEKNITALPQSRIELSVKPSLDTSTVESVKTSFGNRDYQFSDQDNDGYYTAEIFAPDQKGNYPLEAQIVYNDQKVEKVQVQILVDPYGYIYSKILGIFNPRLFKVKVELYLKNNDGWQSWDAKEFNQLNPQQTNKQGEYKFLVPEGQYYLVAKKWGFCNYRSSELTVENGKPINLNIELKLNYWWLLIILALIIYSYYRYKEYKKNKKDDKNGKISKN